jgi:tetratricopeptide (TPR) repeat protein
MSSLTDLLHDQLRHAASRYERLPVMLSIVRQLALVDPEQGLGHAERALALARQLGDERQIALSLRERAICYLGSCNIEAAQHDLNEAARVFIRLEEDQELAAVTLAMGSVCYYRGDYRRAIKHLSESATISDRCGYTEGVIAALQALGNAYSGIGEDAEALDCFHRAIEQAAQLDSPGLKGGLISDLAVFSGIRGDHERALQQFEEALKHFTEPAFELLAVRTISNIANVQYALERLEEAEVNAMRAMHIARSLNESREVAIAQSTLANISERQGDPAAALDWQQKALLQLKAGGGADNRAMQLAILLNIGNLHRKLDNIDDAIYVLAEVVELAKASRDLQIEYRAHQLLAESYERKKDERRAFFHLKKFAQLREQAYDSERDKTVAEIQARFDVARAQQEKERLELELNHRTKEVRSTALHLTDRDALVAKILRKLVEIESVCEGPSRKMVARLLGDLRHATEDTRQREQVVEQLELMYQDFIRTLATRYSTLGRAELVVCALTRAGLTAKEIATLTHVDRRATEQCRLRIRRKMKLEPGADLAMHLAKI